jgi:TonB-linked outer membrane protein, SusC/RagA family
MGKYLLSGSIRVDGASRLADGNKWHSFPSVAGAWIISEEDFMKNINWINNLKLRGSWGISGNAAVDIYSTHQGMQVSNSWGFGNDAASTLKYANTIANVDLTWEKSKTYDIGVDFSVLNGRINFTADYYHTKTSDILMKRDMPTAIYGVGAVMWQNIASTENKGIELSLNTVNYQTRDFEWTSTLTFSKDKEKITSLVDGRNIIAKNDTDYSMLLGKPIKSWWDLKKTGIWQLNEAEEAAKYTYYGSAPKPGDIKVYDATGDYKIEDDDEVYVGSNSPDWVGGFLNTVTYRGFDLSVYMFARWGQTICAKYMYGYNPAGAVSSGNGMQQANIFDTFHYWTPENPTNDFPRPAAETILPTTGRSLYFVDGSFFKIKTLTLGYSFPKKWLGKAGMEKVRVYLTANNLLTKAKSDLLMNYDPEGNGGDEMPLFKTFVAGISVTF